MHTYAPLSTYVFWRHRGNRHNFKDATGQSVSRPVFEPGPDFLEQPLQRMFLRGNAKEDPCLSTITTIKIDIDHRRIAATVEDALSSEGYSCRAQHPCIGVHTYLLFGHITEANSSLKLARTRFEWHSPIGSDDQVGHASRWSKGCEVTTMHRGQRDKIPSIRTLQLFAVKSALRRASCFSTHFLAKLPPDLFSPAVILEP